VGTSQYGADAMAASGSDYTEILQYYYQGTQLIQYED
jgi:SpoIID/LytB domain protein